MDRRLFAATAAALSLAALAAAPAKAQEYDWTGFYVGGTAGWSRSDTSSTADAVGNGGSPVIPPGDVGAISRVGGGGDNNSGFTGSIEGGYNWQSGALLLGVETEYGWFNIDETRSNTYQSGLAITPPVTATVSQGVSTDWIWTLRPRIGYATGPWLFFGSFGVAATKIDYNFNYSDTQGTPRTAHLSASDTKTGWAGGLGGAYMLNPQLSLKGEWLYSDFGNIRVSGSTNAGFATITSEAKVKANILRVGADWKF